MTMDQAATWFAGSILVTLGFLVIIAGVVVVNNLLHKYWKPVKLFTPDSWKGFNPPVYISQDPVLEKDKK
jgi:hypothetical protein